MTGPSLFHCLTFDDADAAMTFLEALGFTERLTVRNDADPSVVEHAQFHWGDCGAIMFGSAARGDAGEEGRCAQVGRSSCYLVVPADRDVDAAYERGLAAGGTPIEPPTDQHYGGRCATVADPEGNRWSIGSYAGE